MKEKDEELFGALARKVGKEEVKTLITEGAAINARDQVTCNRVVLACVECATSFPCNAGWNDGVVARPEK